MELDEFRSSVDAWLDARSNDLVAAYPGAGSLEERMDQIAKVRRLAFDGGWARWG